MLTCLLTCSQLVAVGMLFLPLFRCGCDKREKSEKNKKKKKDNKRRSNSVRCSRNSLVGAWIW